MTQNGLKRAVPFLIQGNFVHSTDQEPLVVMVNYILGVNKGKIVFFESADNLKERQKEYSISDEDVTILRTGQFVMPGMVDTHIHASQYPNAGKGLDLPLLEWLNKYTYPTEARFKDLKIAEAAYRKVVKRVVLNGTTTACYYATIHTDASLLLCDVIDEIGQRAYVGKVNMDQMSPDYYVEHTDQSVIETRRFVETVTKRRYQHITPVITPRFAISCSETLMTKLGELAKEYGNLPIQTHICENVDEIRTVTDMYPDSLHYTDVYDKAGLLTDKTVLAHGIYLTQPELTLIKKRQSGISHCPNSNLSIRSGLLDVRKVMQQNIKVGLGTDVSGGYHPSIMDAMRTAVHVSNTLAITSANGYKPITYREAFYLGTLGGSKALGLDELIGNFEYGKEFDALIIDLNAVNSAVDIFDHDTVEDFVQKFIHNGDDRNITDVFVSGKRLNLKELPA